MIAQRPGRSELRTVPSSSKFGQTGATWGNLRDAGLVLDERFFFEDDPDKRVFQVTRLFGDPHDPARHIAFYEAVHRDPWPGTAVG